jgi:tyrosine decarboxylase/aspartate 1-decarboxylase
MTVWEIADRLKERGWAVSISSYPQAIRIIVMPHLNKEHIESFLTDLREIRI